MGQVQQLAHRQRWHGTFGTAISVCGWTGRGRGMFAGAAWATMGASGSCLDVFVGDLNFRSVCTAQYRECTAALQLLSSFRGHFMFS